MSKGDFNEDFGGKRDEKDEKELSKQEEKWERDRLGALTWAAILIWAGVVMLAANLGAFDLMKSFTDQLPLGLGDFPLEVGFFPVEAWSVFWLGAAAILLLQVVARLLIPDFRRPVTGTLILAVVFLGLGIGQWQCVWPIILIAIGVGILLRGFTRKDG